MPILYILVAIFSGIFAGMGMGGGTFLIPMLALFFSVNQIICQSTNVFCFLITAVFCFLFYVKHKIIDFKALFFVSAPAAIIAFFMSFYSLKIQSNLVKIFFAVFILIIGIITLFQNIKIIKNKN